MNSNALAAAALNCGPRDIDKLEELIDEFNYSYEDIISEARNIFGDNLDVNGVIFVVLDWHVRDVKERILEICNDLFNEAAILCNEKLVDEYEVNIYTNFVDSGYDDQYGFWDKSTNDIELEDIRGFLLDEDIIDYGIDNDEDGNTIIIVGDYMYNAGTGKWYYAYTEEEMTDDEIDEIDRDVFDLIHEIAKREERSNE